MTQSCCTPIWRSRPIRIAVLHFSHETVTFLQNDTTLEDFVYPGSPASGEALLASDPKSYMGGFVKVAREYDGVELVGIESPLWPQHRHRLGLGDAGGLRDLRRPDDRASIERRGAVRRRLSLPARRHGRARRAAARGRTRPAGPRRWSGRKAFIAATFDPHGNEDEEFLRHADMAFTVQIFPAL